MKVVSPELLKSLIYSQDKKIAIKCESQEEVNEIQRVAKNLGLTIPTPSINK